MSVGFPTEWAGEPFIALLITAITHRIVEMPPRALTATRCPGTAVFTHPTVLKYNHISV